MYIAILGRQPSLGLAELERTFGSEAITPILESGATLLKCMVDSSMLNKLGGTTKLTEVFADINETSWRNVEKEILRKVPSLLAALPEGKIHFGLSVYGLNVNAQTINITSLKLKRTFQKSGRSIRAVPNKTVALNSAQVIHNQLIGPRGLEIVVVRHGNNIFLSQTIAEQDIDAYASRDQARPLRDAFVGMLPPKLAQIMINLAAPQKNAVILDPFCGTGVVLQEAALMGHPVYGTDLSEKMIQYSRGNLEWLEQKFQIKISSKLHESDATNATWELPVDTIVSETYLGQPFSAPPSPEKLQQVRGNCNRILGDFLRNLSGQIHSGTSLCLAVPAWRDKSGQFTHLPLIEELARLGYGRVMLKHVSPSDLIYFRPNQIVARQILLLVKT